MRLIRTKENPLLSPSAVPPSQNNLRVFGVFNPGVAVYTSRILLLLRIAERPQQTKKRYITVPVWQHKKTKMPIRFQTFHTRTSDFDTSDPRKIRENGPQGRIRFLTSLSHLRLAESLDGIHFSVAKSPFLFPSNENEAWGCEDARITKIQRTYLINYTSVSSDGIGTSLASTTDFQHVRRYGNIFAPPNRDVGIFPLRIGGHYACLHRPMPTEIGQSSIWYAESPNLLHWGKHRLVLRPRSGMWDSEKVGTGVPPIGTSRGWLVFYHGADTQDRYAIGAVLLDRKKPWHVLGRTHAPLLMPTEPYEQNGVYPSVCFATGAVVRGDTMTLYYGAADTSVCSATLSLRELLSTL